MTDLADTFYPAHQIGEWSDDDQHGLLFDLLCFAHQPWRDQAACRGMDTNLFFPSRGTAGHETRNARLVCNGCPVQAECLEAGMDERQGVWGGTSEKDRRQLRRTRRGEAA